VFKNSQIKTQKCSSLPLNKSLYPYSTSQLLATCSNALLIALY
jgi:hypothetical protein